MIQKHKAGIRKMAWLLFIIYIIMLTYFLFFSERYGRDVGTNAYRYNLVLFQEIKRFIKYRHQLGWESVVVNLFGNIFAFSPFGFVLPIISPKNRKFLNVALLTFEFTLMVEIIQLLLKVGIFDVDDIFLNTIGGMFGYICFAVCNKLVRRS